MVAPALASIAVLTLLALACAVGPLLLPAEHVDPTHASLGPFQQGHILGTDDIGRDLLVRNLSGGRISLAVGGLAMMLTITIATVLGAVDHGYRVIVVADALCSSSDEAHDAALRIYVERFSQQIEVADAEEVLATWQLF